MTKNLRTGAKAALEDLRNCNISFGGKVFTICCNPNLYLRGPIQDISCTY